MTLTLLFTSCVLYDISPYTDNLARLTDADGDGYSLAAGDCNDNNGDIHPGRVDICNGRDDDCDQAADEDYTGLILCVDVDGDGSGDPTTASESCREGATWVTNCGDCDDSNPDFSPSQTEICDRFDNDCDGLIDEEGAYGEGVASRDADRDGHGNPEDSIPLCFETEEFIFYPYDDCDDSNSAVYPGAEEVCGDGVDNNCDLEENICELPSEMGPEEANGSLVGDTYNQAIGAGVVKAIPDVTGGLAIPEVAISVDLPSTGEYTFRPGLAIWQDGLPEEARSIADADLLVWGGVDQLLGGYGAAAAVDFGGSGELRLIVGGPGPDSRWGESGAVFVIDPSEVGEQYLNSASLLWTSPDGSAEQTRFGNRLSHFSSLWDRGQAVAVGEPSSNYYGLRTGAVFVYLLQEDPDSPILTIRGLDDYSRLSHLNACDLDGDGLEELTLYQEISGSGSLGRIFGISGDDADEPELTDIDANYTIGRGSEGQLFGEQMLCLPPEPSSDGLARLVVTGDNGRGQLAIYAGPLEGELSAIDAAETIWDFGSEEPYLQLTSGNIDGDEYLDLIVSDTEVEEQAGQVWVLLGADREGVVHEPGEAADLSEEASLQLRGDRPNQRFGTSIASGQDYNLDGLDDILISDLLGPTEEYEGAVYFYYGSGI